MRLLIVEDEETTLMGLSEMLDWSRYGIDGVFLASNGEKGLLSAREHRPEIVLTDIRMPRMNGISMAEQIRKFLPDVQIIFLSAYQEIDYYKAAISLKAVNYIEKPVIAKEMSKVLTEAVSNLRRNNLLQQAAWEARERLQQKIAQKLLIPNIMLTEEEKGHFQSRGMLKNMTCGYITTVLVWLYEENEGEVTILLFRLIKALLGQFKTTHMDILGARHKHRCLVLHFFSELPDEFSRHITVVRRIFRDVLGEDTKYYITVGKTVHEIQNTYQSWQTAVILLQEVFYEPFGSMKIYYKDDKFMSGYTIGQLEKEKLLYYISERREDEIFALEEQLFMKLRQDRGMMPVSVRNMYAAFFYSLDRQAELMHISVGEEFSAESWQKKLERANLDMLHDIFKKKTKAFFEAIKAIHGEQSLIRQIHSYIDQNYSNELLSLKEISEYIHMSNSHMCTFYKQETGGTINQYLTQVRMEKAQYYLKATNYNISDIAAMTGYREGSYFSRIFKKTYNLTPAEYRIQCQEFK